MPTVTVDGYALHYLDEGLGPPVLLLHGFPLCSASFRAQIDALRTKYRFLVPDHRGFGGTPPPGAEPLSMRRIAQDALAVLDHAGVPQAVVGGVSMGGYATMALVREDAGRVKGLVLVDTQATADDEAGKERRLATAEAIRKDGVGVLVDSMLPKLLSPSAPAPVRQEIEAQIRRATPEGAIAATLGMRDRLDSKEVLARFSGPALVVVGEQDVITPVEKARQLADLISGSTLVTLPEAGHLANAEAPDAFNRALETFLSSIAW